MFKVNDFRGGYSDNALNLNMPDNVFCEFTNVDFIENGGFKVRNGCKRINNEAFPGNVTQIIEWRLKSGVTKTIIIADKTMYVLSSVHGTYEPVQYNGENLVLKSDTVAYTFFKDFFYFTDGSKMYKWSDEVYYLHNLSVKNPYSFKKGDVIKLTISKKESILKSENYGILVDVRNNFPQKIRYPSSYTASDDSLNYREYTNIKCKYVSDNNIYSIKSECERKENGAWTVNYNSYNFDILTNGVGYVSAPYYYTVTEDFADVNNPLPEYERIILNWNEFGTHNPTEFNLIPTFLKVGTVDKYYQFQYDVDNFYPHNFNYDRMEQYYEKFTYTKNDSEERNTTDIFSDLLTEIVSDNNEFNISAIDVPADILNCKYFSYHPMSFRFFASGNDFDPTAVYYSELQDFEKWQSKETEESTDLILNKFYPRYNFGPVKGLITADNYVVGCYKDGFTTISGYRNATPLTAG